MVLYIFIPVSFRALNVKSGFFFATMAKLVDFIFINSVILVRSLEGNALNITTFKVQSV